MKELIKYLIKFLPYKMQISLNFRKRVGYWPSLGRPCTFNERIQYRKLYDNNPLFEICADKIKVRDYVSNKIGAEYLIDLLSVSDTISIDILKEIKGSYVVKTNHDSGGVALVQEGISHDFEKIVEKIERSLAQDFGASVGEPWYSKIRPKVIIERMLIDDNGKPPCDFKFHVFHEKPHPKVILQVDYDRLENHNRSFYDENFELLPFALKYKNLHRKIDVKPKMFEMMELAKKLTSDFEYARADFYLCEDKIYFGEITFAAESGFGRFWPHEFDTELGKYWGNAL